MNFSKVAESLFYFLISILLLIVIGIVLFWLPKFLPFDSNTLSSWVQGIGSVAAVSWAIWSSQNENRRRNETDEKVAKLTAASITLTLATILGDLKQMERSLASAVEDVRGNSDWGVYNFTSCERLKEQLIVIIRRFPSSQEIYTLAPINNSCAFNVAGALDRLNVVVQLFERFIPEIKETSGKPNSDIDMQINLVVNEVINLLEKAVTACQLSSMGHINPIKM